MSSLRHIRPLLALLTILSASLFAAQETIIQSVAGGGNLGGYAPNKAQLELNGSSGIALNPITKELYFSDSLHHQVYKVNSTTGLIELVAGNGTQSFSGDGSTAIGAGIDTPGALSFNAAGTLLYVADNGNVRVRKIDLVSGLITTFAGVGVTTGTNLPGTTTPAPQGDAGPAVSASFTTTVGGIAVAADGSVLVSDTGAHYVRRIGTDGNITGFAGTANTNGNTGDGAAASAARMTSPLGLAFDDAGNLYIAAQGNNRVRKVDTGAVISTFSGNNAPIVADAQGDGGNADVAALNSPASLAFDKVKKILYVGSNTTGAIRSINLGVTPPTITSIATGGNADFGPIGESGIITPGMVSDDLGNLYIVDSTNSSIRRLDIATGFLDTVVGLTTVFGQIGDRSPGSTALLEQPVAMALDDAGNIYIADNGSSSIRRIKTNGTVDTVAGCGVAGFSGDGGPAVQARIGSFFDIEVIGTNLYIPCNNTTRVIRVVDLTTGLIRTLAQGFTANLRSLAKDQNGNLLVGTNTTIQRVSVTDGTITDFAGTGAAATLPVPGGDDAYTGAAVNAAIATLRGIAVAPNGDVYSVEAVKRCRVRRYSADGTTTALVAGSNTGAAGFAGDGADALTASFSAAYGIAVTSSGNLVVADTANQRIRLINTTVTPNIISTLAGDGTAGLTGDGGPSTLARVNNPQEIIDVGGVLFIADVGNNRIRTITSATVIDPKLLAFAAKLSFTKDKKTGLQIRGKDSITIKAGLLPLPAGINSANLVLRVNIVLLQDQIQLDSTGKLPKAVKAAKPSKTTPLFDYLQYKNNSLITSKFSFSLKTPTTGTETKPLTFGYSAKGTFSDDLGPAGFINKTTATPSETISGVRVNITLDNAGISPVTFTGVFNADYKATLDKSGAAKSQKVK